jgi:phosphoglycolate phosphatase-like HAD superfamily hydrolase
VAHLVWDWNGTLLNDLDLVVTATNASLASVGGPVISADEHRRDFFRPVSAYYQHVLGRPVDMDQFVVLDRVFHDTYRAGLAACRLAADALDAIGAWSGSQSLLSMWFHADLVPTVDRYGLTPRLSRVDGLRAEVGGGSKAPHLAEHLTALGLAGPECVLIGDSVDDAESAVSVGAHVVLYSGGFTDEPRLRATGLPVAGTLTGAVELARALVTTAGVAAPPAPAGYGRHPVAGPAW